MSIVTSLMHLYGIPSFDSTFGSIYLGVTVGGMLYGLTIHQAYRYFKQYPEDGFFYPKGVVMLILLFETLHTIVWTYIGYRYMVSEAFDVGGALRSHWTISLTFIITPCSLHTCQGFYGYRIWSFGGKFYRWLLIPAVLTTCVGIAFSVLTAVKAFVIVTLITDLPKIRWGVSIAYGCSAGSDIMLAGTLMFALLRVRKESTVRSTRNLMNTLIIYTINTGVLTSVVSLLVFIFAIILPGNLIYSGLSIVGARLYANSVLALLNSRRYLNNCLQDDFNHITVRSRGDGVVQVFSSSPSESPMCPALGGQGRDSEITSSSV
ncbi:hypothetical protein GY45DRAFT_1373922 [Cubamyces sp. BRFM 1775]|nr:hypothetical protein GY45DRAFT_1373922 [Cubamyces sp. BRFM 1775]